MNKDIKPRIHYNITKSRLEGFYLILLDWADCACLGFTTSETAYYNSYYKWEIQASSDRMKNIRFEYYIDDLGGLSLKKEIFFDHIKKNYPVHFEWMLFNSFWLG